MVDMYRYFGEMCCLHHQLTPTLTEAAFFSETSVHKYPTTNCHRLEDSCLQSWRLEPENLVLFNAQKSWTHKVQQSWGIMNPIHSNISKVLQLLGCADNCRERYLRIGCYG